MSTLLNFHSLVVYDKTMRNETIPIVNKLGLHARAAARFVSLASTFSSEIEVERNNRRVNGKSILGVMMLAAAKGCEVTLRITGKDEKKALSALKNLIRSRFGEAE